MSYIETQPYRYYFRTYANLAVKVVYSTFMIKLHFVVVVCFVLFLFSRDQHHKSLSTNYIVLLVSLFDSPIF